MRRLAGLLLVLLCILFLFSGCWSYREVEDRAIIAGCAVDKSIEDKKLHLTLEIVNITGDTKSIEPKSLLVESDGYTVEDAVQNAQQKLSTLLYWANCQIIIISKDLAKLGIQPLLDYFMRDSQPRPTVEVLISETATAREILTQQGLATEIVSFQIDKALENNPKILSNSTYNQLFQIYDTMTSETDLTLPAVMSVDNKGKPTPQLDGDAIFLSDKLVGFLNPYDTRFFLFVVGQVSGGELPEKIGRLGSYNISLEILKSKTKIKVMPDSEIPSFVIQTNTSVTVDDLETASDVTDETDRSELRRIAEESLEENIARVIREVQTVYKTDIFGFGELIADYNPKLWRRISADWAEIFPGVRVVVESKITIRNSALMKKSMGG